jgi:hypothetical protein
MKMGNTFVTIGSQKFLAAIFRRKNIAMNFFGRKFARQIEQCRDGTLEIRVQCFSDELFSCGKNISAERLYGRNIYF